MTVLLGHRVERHQPAIVRTEHDANLAVVVARETIDQCVDCGVRRGKVPLRDRRRRGRQRRDEAAAPRRSAATHAHGCALQSGSHGYRRLAAAPPAAPEARCCIAPRLAVPRSICWRVCAALPAPRSALSRLTAAAFAFRFCSCDRSTLAARFCSCDAIRTFAARGAILHLRPVDIRGAILQLRPVDVRGAVLRLATGRRSRRDSALRPVDVGGAVLELAAVHAGGAVAHVAAGVGRSPGRCGSWLRSTLRSASRSRFCAPTRSASSCARAIALLVAAAVFVARAGVTDRSAAADRASPRRDRARRGDCGRRAANSRRGRANRSGD